MTRMSSKDIAPELRRSANNNIRAMVAPACLASAKQAMLALDRSREYRRLEYNANILAMQRSGSDTGRLAAERCEKYGGAAAAWEEALGAWIKAQL